MKSVYVMESKGLYKIGVSKDPQKRLRNLGIGNCDIRLIYESKKISNAYTVENVIHKNLREYKVGREWFLVPSEKELLDAVNGVVEKNGFCTVEIKQEPLKTDEKIKKFIDWVLSPQKRKLDELCKEIDKIEDENRILATQLIKAGWTQEEVDALIDATLKNFPG